MPVPHRQVNLTWLRTMRRVCIAGVLLIAGVTLLAWLLPPVASVLPHGWQRMKANTALLCLLSLGSLLLTERGRSRMARGVGYALAGVVFLLASLTFLQFFGVHAGRIDTLLAADPLGIVPGRPSIQVCVGFMVMSLALLFLGWHRRAMVRLADGTALLLCFFVLSFIGASFFTRDGLPGWSLTTQISAQAFVCFLLLTMYVTIRRMEPGGVFYIVLDGGIGGRTARVAGPAALVLPFLIAALREVMVRFHILSVNYAIAIAPAITALVALLLILRLAQKNRDLEQTLQNLSVRDDLTGLYNRRGFLRMADRAFHEAQRLKTDMSLVFFDVDNLKTINDTAGHEDGSRLLQRFAEALTHEFRFTEMVGRLGGDEFVACAPLPAEELEAAAKRVSKGCEESGGPCLSFSFGLASRMADGGTLDDLLDLADRRMYETKRQKKRAV